MQNSPGTVAYGNHVLPRLLEGLEKYRVIASNHRKRDLGQTVVLGCVPWFDNWDIANVLAKFDRGCVVLDKAQGVRQAARSLNGRLQPILGNYFPDLRGLSHDRLPSGALRPTNFREPQPRGAKLGPIRRIGWTDPKWSNHPHLHAKVIVVGAMLLIEDDEYYTGDIPLFVPVATWHGSANWTAAATGHIETGVWSSDPGLVNANKKFLEGLIASSEPETTQHSTPTPELDYPPYDDQFDPY